MGIGIGIGLGVGFGGGLPLTPPAAPTGLTATAVSATQINLAWDAAADVKIERGTNGVDYVQIDTAVVAVAYEDTGLAAGTYYYRIRATNAAGDSDYSDVASATANLEAEILNLPGVIAYWPLNETSGTVADNAEGTAALDGVYSGSRTLAGAMFPVGDAVVSGTGTGGYINVPTEDLLAVFDWSMGWWLGWALLATAELTDGGRNSWFKIRRNGQEDLVVSKDIADYSLSFDFYTGGVRKVAIWHCSRDQWSLLALVWDVDGDGLKIYIDGVLVQTMAGMGTPVLGEIFIPDAYIGTGQGVFIGGLGHHAIGAGAILTDTQINRVYEAVRPTTREITFSGDSKSNSNDSWPVQLLMALETSSGDLWRERPRRLAEAGYTASSLHAQVDTHLPGIIGNPESVLLNIGANDQSQGTNEATFKAELTGCIDAYRSKFPTANIYVAFPYREDGATPTSPADMKTWIQAVIATYPSNVFAGHDETVWFSGDIATYSDDGAHYNAAGAAEVVNQWMTAMGY